MTTDILFQRSKFKILNKCEEKFFKQRKNKSMKNFSTVEHSTDKMSNMCWTFVVFVLDIIFNNYRNLHISNKKMFYIEELIKVP